MIIGEDFHAAMRAAGLDYAGPIAADGSCTGSMADDDRAKNSWSFCSGK